MFSMREKMQSNRRLPVRMIADELDLNSEEGYGGSLWKIDKRSDMY